MLKVYIQKKNGEFLNRNCYDAWDGFYKCGFEVDFFEKLEDIKDLSKNTIVNGGVGVVRDAFDKIGVKQPELFDYPEELKGFLKRNIYKSTLSEVCNKLNKEEFKNPVFIKPSNKHKHFSGRVINSFADLIPIAYVEDDCEIWVSEVLKIFSEHRVFILNKEIIGVKHYNGNYFSFPPDKYLIVQMIKCYKNAPISYSLDVGSAVGGNYDSYYFPTVLIEVNDAFALGNYGLNSIKYCRMIEARWKEIVNYEG